MTDLKNMYTLHLEKHKKGKAKPKGSVYNPVYTETTQGFSCLTVYFQWKAPWRLDKIFLLQITKCCTSCLCSHSLAIPSVDDVFYCLACIYTHTDSAWACKHTSPKLYTGFFWDRYVPKADGNISKSTTSSFMGKYAAGVELGWSLMVKSGLFVSFQQVAEMFDGGEILFWNQLKNTGIFSRFLPLCNFLYIPLSPKNFVTFLQLCSSAYKGR